MRTAPNTARARRAALGLVLAVGVAVPTTVVASAASADTPAGPLLSYVVNTRANHGQTMKAEREVADLGGTVVIGYDEIGVVIARSTDPAFAAKMRAMNGIDSVGATRTVGISPSSDSDPVEVASPGTAAADPASLQANQWDMKLIGAVDAHKVNPGSRNVVVGVLDSGVDGTHPNLAPNVDASLSAGCLSGAPDTSFAAWQPTTQAHGTHVAGTIAAADNGTGIVGVAPGVRLAAVKVVDDNGFIYAEAAVCGFVWAGEHHFQVTNNSYFVDPWLYNCPDDPDQAAILEAMSRATAFADHQGVLNVAAAGNDDRDLTAKTVDTISPDDSTPVTRTVTNSCLSVPTELPGVLTVSSSGAFSARSYFSNYGLGKIAVTAPGGDRKFQIPNTPDKNGRVLSTLPGGTWGYLQGTSMASPHAAGVAALLASSHPGASPEMMTKLTEAEATPLACPAGPDPGGATCTGTTALTSFYGSGMVNALAAVS